MELRGCADPEREAAARVWGPVSGPLACKGPGAPVLPTLLVLFLPPPPHRHGCPLPAGWPVPSAQTTYVAALRLSYQEHSASFPSSGAHSCLWALLWFLP